MSTQPKRSKKRAGTRLDKRRKKHVSESSSKMELQILKHLFNSRVGLMKARGIWPFMLTSKLKASVGSVPDANGLSSLVE